MKQRRIMVLIAGVVLAALLLTGCSLPEPVPPDVSDSQSSAPVSEAAQERETPPPAEPTAAPSEVPEVQTKAEKLLEDMTLREKVGQLFIIRPEALNFSLTPEKIEAPKENGAVALSDTMKAALQEYPVGGIIMFGKNLISPDQITEFNREFQQSSAIPLFLCIDEEGGSVARLANHPAFDLPKYKSAAEVGNQGDPKAAEQMGETIGDYLRSYGFNVDFAPDADVNTNPDNPVIGTRAFSPDAQTAAQMARGMADGLRSKGIMPVFKHFPGHGDTKEDSHQEIAITDKTKEEMEACEWLPFRQAQAQEGIMVGHIAVPQLTGDLTPASLSGAIVTELLKGQLGFQGLVITDALAMKAISNHSTAGDAAVTAFQAGCDILLLPTDYREAFDGVLTAVGDGRITEQELDRRVLRILECKEFYGIL